MLFIAQLFHYNVDDMLACLSQIKQENILLEHLKCCFKRLVKHDHTPLFKQDLLALLTDQTLTLEQLKLRFQEGIKIDNKNFYELETLTKFKLRDVRDKILSETKMRYLWQRIFRYLLSKM